MYKEMSQIMADDPIMRNSHHFYEMTREEKMSTHMQKMHRAYQLYKKEWFVDISEQQPGVHYMNDINQGGMVCSLHFLMFLDSLQSFSTPEQYDKWVQAGKEGRVLGSYSQTEIGHGSDISGL